MSDMDIFEYEPELVFSTPKTAAVHLDEDPQTWTRQVLTELYRLVPEVSEYTPEVMFLKVDKEQGYALGVVVITSATDSALSATRVGGSAKKALVPVIIKNHLLMPMDLMMSGTGKMVPLNAHRLRSILFRPETFEMITEDWGDTTLYNMFYPPGRSDNDFGAGISQGMGGGTAGAVTHIQGPGMKLSFELLEAALPTVRGQDIEEVAKTLHSTPGLVKASAENTAMLGALRLLSEAQDTAVKSASGLCDVAISQARPSVFQFGFDESRAQYWVKTSSRVAYYGVTDSAPVQYMSRKEFLKQAGPEVTQKVDTEGTVTLTGSGTAAADPDVSNWEIVEKPGIYKVRTVQGKEMTGWVIPGLLDLDGTRSPIAVFTNGAAAMIQDQIVGSMTATGVDLPASPPRGTGVFYVSGQGGIEATAPLAIKGKEAGMDGGDSWLVHTLSGEEGRIRIVPGVQGMKALGGDIMVSPSVKFLSLDTEIATPLVRSLDGLDKTAAAVAGSSITVFSDSYDTYEFRYHNLPKLAAASGTRLDLDDAMLVLCSAGLDSKTAHNRLSAALNGSIKISGVSDVRLAKDLIQSTRKLASARSAEVMALRQNLVKEASVFPNAMTVDAVLSLGFINSENIRMYISRLPYIEQCLSMLCELLLASRLGLNEIPEFAAARGVRALDETVQGLRSLALRDPDAETTASS